MNPSDKYMDAESAQRLCQLRHKARYAKLGWQVGKIHFDVLEIRNWLCEGRNSDIVGERQNLSLPVWCTKKIHEIFNTYFRFIKCDPELSLRAKIFLILRVIGDKGYLPQSSTNRNNHVMSFRNRARQRSSLRLCHEFSDIICHSQSQEVCTINNRKTRWNKTFDFQVRSEWAGSDIFDVVSYSALIQFHMRASA